MYMCFSFSDRSGGGGPEVQIRPMANRPSGYGALLLTPFIVIYYSNIELMYKAHIPLETGFALATKRK